MICQHSIASYFFKKWGGNKSEPEEKIQGKSFSIKENFADKKLKTRGKNSKIMEKPLKFKQKLKKNYQSRA